MSSADHARGTRANPCTSMDDPSFRLGRFCRCTTCGVVAKCSRTFDFYTRKGLPGVLACEGCNAGAVLFLPFRFVGRA